MAANDLANFTTLGVGGPATRIILAKTEEELISAVKTADNSGQPLLILGGGSNIFENSIRVSSSGDIYLNGYFQNNKFLVVKLPSDGSLTGTYTVGIYTFTYAATTLTDAVTTLTDSASTLTDAATTVAEAASTLTDAASTLTSTVTTL